MMLDRPRHKEIVDEIRGAGASLRMIGDGDIAAAMAPAIPDSGVDLYMGIGGAPEAVLAAAGIKCLGGDMQCKMWPRDEKERKNLVEEGYEKELDRIYTADDLANGKTLSFVPPASAIARFCVACGPAGRYCHHPFDFHAGEKPHRPVYSRQPRLADKNNQASVR